MRFIRKGGRIIPIREKSQATDTARKITGNALNATGGYMIGRSFVSSGSFKSKIAGILGGFGISVIGSNVAPKDRDLSGAALHFSGVIAGASGLTGDTFKKIGSSTSKYASSVSVRAKKLNNLRKVTGKTDNVIHVNFRK
jgi:hypothetical protein